MGIRPFSRVPWRSFVTDNRTAPGERMHSPNTAGSVNECRKVRAKGMKTGVLLPADGSFRALPAIAEYRSMPSTVTGCHSVSGQTEGNPKKPAWSDKLHSAIIVVAVSRGLLPPGLTKGPRMAIQVFKKDFVVWCKKAAGIQRAVDISMSRHTQAVDRKNRPMHGPVCVTRGPLG